MTARSPSARGLAGRKLGICDLIAQWPTSSILPNAFARASSIKVYDSCIFTRLSLYSLSRFLVSRAAYLASASCARWTRNASSARSSAATRANSSRRAVLATDSAVARASRAASAASSDASVAAIATSSAACTALRRLSRSSMASRDETMSFSIRRVQVTSSAITGSNLASTLANLASATFTSSMIPLRTPSRSLLT